MIDTNSRIILVESSDTRRKIIRNVLQNMGLPNITTCQESSAVLDNLRNTRYDLILIDSDMPGGEGFNLIGQIRADASINQIYAIMIGHDDTQTARDVALSAGANDYIPRPFNLNELRAYIDKIS